MKRKRESSDDDDDYVDDDDGTDLIFSQGDLQHSRLIRKFSLKIEKNSGKIWINPGTLSLSLSLYIYIYI